MLLFTIFQHPVGRLIVLPNHLQLKEIFTSQMDAYMQDNGFCCGRWYRELDRTILCAGKRGCVVELDTVYYRLGFLFIVFT